MKTRFAPQNKTADGKRNFRTSKDGVAEILGTLLLIGITVVLMAGLAILVLSIKPPADQINVDVEMLTSRGADGAWGSGDEQVRVHHLGGEPLPQDGFSIEIGVGATSVTYAGAGLTGPFSDGELTIGETWNATLTIPADEEVSVQIISNSKGTSTLIQSGIIRSGGGCVSDLIPPTVNTWVQTPPDVDGLTTGAVVVTATLADACGTVDETANPSLAYRINPGTDPAFTNAGVMTKTATNTWTGTIPAQTWATLYGQSLQYQLTGMKDTSGNTGSSLVRTDIIQFVGIETFVQSHTAVVGTVGTFANMQSASDSGATATLTESTSVAVNPYYATGSSGSGGVGSAADVRNAPNNLYYALDSNTDTITGSSISTGAASGAISKVEFIFEGHYRLVRTDDAIDLKVDAGDGFIVVANDWVPSPGSAGVDGQKIVDITGIRGSWSWANVQNLQLRAEYEKQTSQDAMVVYVDAMWVRVTLAGGNTDMDVRFTFPAFTPSPSNVLELRYSAAQESFNVEVWDGTVWTQRGTALNQAVMTGWVYSLTPTEAAPLGGGGPQFRIVDASMTSPQGVLQVDFARVVSA